MARAERVRRIKDFLKKNLNNTIHKKEDTIIWHAKEKGLDFGFLNRLYLPVVLSRPNCSVSSCGTRLSILGDPQVFFDLFEEDIRSSWTSICKENAIEPFGIKFRDEKWAVPSLTDDFTKPIFHWERPLVVLFGMKSFGAHLNCYSKIGDDYHLWIARRSKTKPNFPNLLDNCAAGGLPANTRYFRRY